VSLRRRYRDAATINKGGTLNRTVQEELEIVRSRSSGIVRPEDVVEFAKDPNTAMHSRFTWDDTEAARKHRLWEARELIRLCVSIIPQDEQPIRTFVSLGSDRVKPGGGYRSTEEVLSVEEMRTELLEQALKEFRLWKSKYERLTELNAVFAAAEKVQVKSGRKASRTTKPLVAATA
jgi:hypothetical protein